MLATRHANIEFFGKDGFHWFIGQVVPDKSWRTENNQNFDNGFRAKVRILGHHPGESSEQGGISDEDLPWAHFLVSPQFGAGNNYQGTSFALQGGEMVFGFFLDGEDGQQPVIIGAFYANHNIKDVLDYKTALENGTSNWKPIGFDPDLEKGKNIRLQRDEPLLPSGGVTDSSSTIKDENKTKKPVIIKHYDNKVYEVKKAEKCTTPGGAMGDVSKVLKSFIKATEGLDKYKDGYIDPVLNRIVNMDKLIDKASNKIAAGLSATIRGQRKELFKAINEKVDSAVTFLDPAHLIKNLEIKKQKDSIYCLIENILNGLKKFVSNFLKELIGKVVNIPLCAAEQFISGMMAQITDKINGLIGPAISSISKLTGISMPSFQGMMTKALDIAQTGLDLLKCEGNFCEVQPYDFVTNIGPDPKSILDFNRMLGFAGGLSGFGGGIDSFVKGMFPDIDDGAGLGPVGALAGGCNTQSKNCGPPRIEIFGGGGSEAVANAVINNVGEVVGTNMTNLGFGYVTPPYVTIFDDCDRGKGATGVAVVEDGRVVNVVITNPGGGYQTPDNVSDTEGVDVIGEVDNIQVVATGAGYSEGDLIVSNSGQTLTPVIEDGRITGATGKIDLGLTAIPALSVKTSTGSGAIIRPITKFVKREEYKDPIVPDAELIRVVDCARIY